MAVAHTVYNNIVLHIIVLHIMTRFEKPFFVLGTANSMGHSQACGVGLSGRVNTAIAPSDFSGCQGLAGQLFSALSCADLNHIFGADNIGGMRTEALWCVQNPRERIEGQSSLKATKLAAIGGVAKLLLQ